MVIPDGLNRQWIIFDDGSVGSRGYEGDEEPPLWAPGRFVSEAEYVAARDVLKAADDAHCAAVHAVEQAALRTDYEALRAAGIPVVSAERLSGFTDHGEGAREVKP